MNIYVHVYVMIALTYGYFEIHCGCHEIEETLKEYNTIEYKMD